VGAVFPESSLSNKLAEAIARQTGARADLTLYGDTLGPAGSPGATYVGMETANADAMVRGFTNDRQRCRPAAS
jgi:ABC-type Zn uptake system ZnuABC Zn-binding protein ZnuA